MSKKELIDKAVEQRKGKWLGDEYDRICLTSGGKFFFIMEAFNSILEDDVFCTRAEFEQRAKELGWVNGYKWGVEYPTNGQKPDLADDVRVQIKEFGDWLWSTRLTVSEWDWNEDVTHFRITDERYKPVERPPEAMPVSAEMEAKIARASVNWYDYDKQEAIALPHVGVKVEFKYKIDENWLKCRTCHVICFYGGRAWLHLDGNESSNIYDVSQFEFRPLDWNRKAEEDKKRVVGTVLDSIKLGYNREILTNILEHVYDLGFLKLPEQKK